MEAFTQITLNHYLALSGILFMIGMIGVMMRRNIIVIYMGLELMLNAANLALVSFSRFSAAPNLEGHIMVFFIITVAAAEVAVGLALIVALYRLKQTTNTGDLTSLKF
jgi:NADH-quinone oxidoreductase subunit K